MITSKILTPLKKGCIQLQKNSKSFFHPFQKTKLSISQVLNHKRRGQAWMGGMYFLLTILVLFMLLLNKAKMEHIVTVVEDALTTSALGGLNWDNRSIAISHNIVIDDEEKCYQTVCDLVGKNLGLTQINQNTFDGNYVLFSKEGGYRCVTRMILYDVYADGHIQSYDFVRNENGYTKTEASESVTPQGENITSTSIYLEYEFPVRICGFVKRVKKGEYVSITDI